MFNIKTKPKNVLYLDLSTYLNPSMVGLLGIGFKYEPKSKYCSLPDDDDERTIAQANLECTYSSQDSIYLTRRRADDVSSTNTPYKVTRATASPSLGLSESDSLTDSEQATQK